MFSDNRNAVVESLIYFSDIRGIAQDRNHAGLASHGEPRSPPSGKACTLVF